MSAVADFVGARGELFTSGADYRGVGRSWRGDLLAGLTVGIVALPLLVVIADVLGVLGGFIVGLAESASVSIVGAQYRAAAAFVVPIDGSANPSAAAPST